MSPLELNEWIDLNINNHLGINKELEWRSVWSIACHLLWQWRNKEIFLEDFARPFEPWRVLVQQCRDYLKASHVNMLLGNGKQLGNIQWIPPCRG